MLSSGAGMDAYLSKPVNMSNLAEVLDRYDIRKVELN
jgi:response regulator of citrate/malate metabolism